MLWGDLARHLAGVEGGWFSKGFPSSRLAPWEDFCTPLGPWRCPRSCPHPSIAHTMLLASGLLNSVSGVCQLPSKVRPARGWKTMQIRFQASQRSSSGASIGSKVTEVENKARTPPVPVWFLRSLSPQILQKHRAL